MRPGQSHSEFHTSRFSTSNLLAASSFCRSGPPCPSNCRRQSYSTVGRLTRRFIENGRRPGPRQRQIAGNPVHKYERNKAHRESSCNGVVANISGSRAAAVLVELPGSLGIASIRESNRFHQIFAGKRGDMGVTYPCSGTHCLAPPAPRRPWQFTISCRSSFIGSAHDLPAESLPEGCSKIQIDGGSSGYDKVE
jgi:hypothetical protein